MGVRRKRGCGGEQLQKICNTGLAMPQSLCWPGGDSRLTGWITKQVERAPGARAVPRGNVQRSELMLIRGMAPSRTPHRARTSL